MKTAIKLLCIDDDPSVLEMIRSFFDHLGYTVFTAENGTTGLEIFAAHAPDIVLVDLKMPDINGLQVLEAITKASSNTPVLVISGEGEMADVIQALRLGAWHYQTKPIENMPLFQHAVEQALEKAGLFQENQAYQRGLEKRLHMIIENFDGFVFTCDNRCRITYMNSALEKHIGHQAIGENCHKAIFGYNTKCIGCDDDHFRSKLNSKKEVQDAKTGRWYYAIQSPVLDHKGNVLEYQVIMHDITERKKAVLDLQEKEAVLRKENERLRESLSDRYRFGDIIGKSKPMHEVYKTILNAAASDAGVIIYGESGTGKELVAKAIHTCSDRKEADLIYVNCSAIPENLIESEFFGYKQGAFTGAVKDKPGFLDMADQGTLFLDEVGELPPSLQVKLLRVMEGYGYTPVGATKVKKPNFRIIAATHRDLKALTEQGLMRHDFLYRIHVIPVHLPPLRERKEDISLLVDHFLEQYDPEKLPPITPGIIKALQSYEWPGNVRELQNTIHRFVSLKKLDFLNVDCAYPLEQKAIYESHSQKETALTEIMERYEREILEAKLAQFKWHKSKAAEALKIDRKTLFNKMKKYDLAP